MLLLASLIAASPTPPPIRMAPAGTIADRGLVVGFTAGPATCAGGTRISSERFIEPIPLLLGSNRTSMNVTVEFSVDDTGRPYSIKSDFGRRLRAQDRDILPSLAASRFEVDRAHSDCSITYEPFETQLADAPLETVARINMLPRMRLPKNGWDRLAPGDCRTRPSPAPLVRAYPDFRELEPRAGAREWTYVGYDLDADGVPVNVSTISSSGSAELDEAGRMATANSRFAVPGPRTGCARSFWKNAAIVEAPEPPEQSEFGDPDVCDIDDRWERKPNLTFPEAYRRRSINGWAILRYDVAPWGEIGSIEVLASQPTMDFGEAARRVVSRARYKEMDTGLRNCIERVIFRMNDYGASADKDGSE